MSGPRVRAAIVGGGLMGRWHAHAIARVGGTVVAVVDADKEKARLIACKHGSAIASDSLDPVLAKGDIDVLHVCTPVDSHEQLARKAAYAGLHVLMEKPLAQNVALTDALLQLADSRGVLLCPVHQFLFQRGTLRAVQELATIGPLRHVDAVACSAGADGGGDREPDDVAFDILSHPLSLFQRLAPVPISSVPWHARRPRPGELRAVGFSSELSFSILVSMAGRPTRHTLRVVGEGGTAHVDLYHGFCVIEPGAVSRGRKMSRPFTLSARTFAAAASNLARRALRNEPAFPGLRELIARFYAAIAANGEPPISPQETLEVARVRDTLIEMARARR